ncbi:MAG: diaminopimelate decarboxylase family protein [Candidatus Hodarchaeales archaeon]
MTDANVEYSFAPELLTRRENGLYFDNYPISNIIGNFETPLFIFSRRQLVTQFDKISEAFSQLRVKELAIAFSVKSNPEEEIIKTFSLKQSLFEVTSLGEMKRVLSQGVLGRNIIYTNIVKPIETIKFAITNGIIIFAADSLNDLKRIETIAKSLDRNVKILLRINVMIPMKNTIFSCIGAQSKIGFLIDYSHNSELGKAIQLCTESSFITLEGLHIHMGSQIVDLESYRKGLKVIKSFIDHLLKINIKINTLDLGGGFPVNYDMNQVPSIESFAKLIKLELQEYLSELTLIIESGRFLTAPAGILIFTIENIKKDGVGNTIICVDGSFYNTIPDIIVANWKFPILNLETKSTGKRIKYRLVGSTNDTLDSYQNHYEEKITLVDLYELKIGDKIVVLQTGAYSLSFNSTYCLEERPKVIYV